MHSIATPRLSLRLMAPEFLKACLEEDRERAEALIGLTISPDWFLEKDLIALRLQDCRIDPRYAPWSLRAIGLASTGVMVGHIGFHTCPDPDYLRPLVGDGIELGYTVYPQYRRQGYALEASQGLIRWAAQVHGIGRFVVSIAPANVASTALAAKMGFARISEHLDEVDGLEYIYLLEGERLEELLRGA